MAADPHNADGTNLRLVYAPPKSGMRPVDELTVGENIFRYATSSGAQVYRAEHLIDGSTRLVEVDEAFLSDKPRTIPAMTKTPLDPAQALRAMQADAARLRRQEDRRKFNVRPRIPGRVRNERCTCGCGRKKKHCSTNAR